MQATERLVKSLEPLASYYLSMPNAPIWDESQQDNLMAPMALKVSQWREIIEAYRAAIREKPPVEFPGLDILVNSDHVDAPVSYVHEINRH